MKLRIAGVACDSVVDGPGLRSVIFAQGCSHNCKGCHNPETHDFSGGREVEALEAIRMMKLNALTRGVTFSGGDPFFQAEAFSRLAEIIRGMGKDIVTYTGYTWEELIGRRRPDELRLLSLTDILVDGPFILSLRDPTLPFRGSANQRIIDVRESLRAKYPGNTERPL